MRRLTYRVDEVHSAEYTVQEMRDDYALAELATTFALEGLRTEFAGVELVTAGLVEARQPAWARRRQ